MIPVRPRTTVQVRPRLRRKTREASDIVNGSSRFGERAEEHLLNHVFRVPFARDNRLTRTL